MNKICNLLIENVDYNSSGNFITKYITFELI
jgi:hypothetical protein